jgi:AraC-like DNA-binding protein
MALNSGITGDIFTAPILERLVEVLLVEALRFRSASAAREAQRLLAGLSDPGLARTFREIHVDAACRWTVDQLARAGGMSRAVFAERFARKVGCRPCITCLSGAWHWRRRSSGASALRWLRSPSEWGISPRARSVRRARARLAACPGSSLG